MARLRVRIELNRRMAGVPLDKMASVIEETRKFFFLLAEDVHIEAERGEWLASDFDAESLNFTAEYGGPVSPQQVQAFGAAFSGATSLRRVTIAQFTRIADFLGEDELVGFGLYQSDQETEPTEWRCLSKRDAMRFGEEIKLLAEAAGEALPETQLPAVMNGSVAGRRLFKDRRERETLAADPSRLVREMESNLSRRIVALESEVADQTRKLRQIGTGPDLAEERFQKLLAAMETFWAQAPRPFLQLPAPEAPVASALRAAPEVQAAPEGPPATEAPAILEVPAALQTPAVPEAPAAQQLPPAPKAVLAPEVPPATEVLLTEDVPLAPVEAPVQVAPVQVAPAAAPNVPAAPIAPRRWSIAGIAIAATIAVVAGLAFPEMQHQWMRFSSVETLPSVKPKSPAVPVLPQISASGKPTVHSETQPVVKTVAARSSEPFIGPLIPLEVPAKVKSQVQSEVRVDVVVAIDPDGNVTGARVSSTQGESARLLVTEALRAARQSRFRPAREGKKTVPSHMILTFLFKPESNEF
jgi:hypothetical protein